MLSNQITRAFARKIGVTVLGALAVVTLTAATVRAAEKCPCFHAAAIQEVCQNSSESAYIAKLNRPQDDHYNPQIIACKIKEKYIKQFFISSRNQTNRCASGFETDFSMDKWPTHTSSAKSSSGGLQYDWKVTRFTWAGVGKKSENVGKLVKACERELDKAAKNIENLRRVGVFRTPE